MVFILVTENCTLK